MNEKKKIRRYSKISILHIGKLIFRSAIFLAAVWFYIFGSDRDISNPFHGAGSKFYIFTIIWFVFFAEILLRFFPSNFESMGCQKQFHENYRPVKEKSEIFTGSRRMVLAAWGILNAIIGILYFVGVIDRSILILISLAYAVCDMICILYFCPFQTFFMKNKCCTTCRIYNWDYAMMFTPLIFVPGIFTWSLLLLALLLVIAWEIRLYKYPERFSENCNANLSCRSCKEKLCRHKKQLQKFLRNHKRVYIGFENR